jgi:type I restriction enzyme S subunit
LKEGDILWNSTGTGTIGRAAVFRGLEGFDQVVVDSHVTVIRCARGVLPTYLRHFIASSAIQNRISEMQSGSTNQVELSKQEVLKTELPLPPSEEQRRIIWKLDSLFGKAKRAREELGHIPRLVERYKQAILASSFRGDLTADWRKSNSDLPWRTVTLSELIEEGPSNGWSPKSGPDAAGALTLKLTATTSGKFRLDEGAVKRIYEIPPPSSAYWLKPGDLLVQRSNSIEYVGTAAIFDGPPDTYIYPDLMMRIRMSDHVNRQYVWRFLNSEGARSYFRQNATGTAGNMPKITGQMLRALPVPFPISRDERQVIIQLIGQAFTWIDRIAIEYDGSSRLIDKLDQSILAKAFKGDLVPQDPSDEPASVLLERIRAEREGWHQGEPVYADRGCA